ncbi:hypothetical protein CBD41_07980 [bacterium TMED181]|nr:hypothetical protein [Planctomycetota bacterium]OUW43055.1 MAG: hypothetical protein CBD41_07980 [bacterium TMED181]
MDAKKVRLGQDEALELAGKASMVIVARGKKLVEHDMKKDRPSDEELAKGIMGPSGNLRAPTLVVGKKMLVGFNEAAYQAVIVN